MQLNHVITMVVFRRPEYTKRVLEHLSRCRGIEKYEVVVQAEPGHFDVLDIVDSFEIGCRKKHLMVNRTCLGCTANTLKSLNNGFLISDFVIHVEDDILMAPDALEYFEYAASHYVDDPDVFTVSGYHREEVGPEQYKTIFKERWFTPWGWGTWQDRYREIREVVPEASKTSIDSWDCLTNHVARGQRCQITPKFSRTQNIGGELGTYCPGPEWHKENVFNTCWSGQEGIVIPDGPFEEKT